MRTPGVFWTIGCDICDRSIDAWCGGEDDVMDEWWESGWQIDWTTRRARCPDHREDACIDCAAPLSDDGPERIRLRCPACTPDRDGERHGPGEAVGELLDMLLAAWVSRRARPKPAARHAGDWQWRPADHATVVIYPTVDDGTERVAIPMHPRDMIREALA